MQIMHNGVSANEEGDNRQGKSNLCSACGRFATDFAIRLIRFRGCNSRIGTRASFVGACGRRRLGLESYRGLLVCLFFVSFLAWDMSDSNSERFSCP